MAQIIFTVPDEVLPNIVEAFCVTFGYQPTVSSGTASAADENPITPGEFTRQQVITMVRSVVADYQIKHARDAAEIETRAQLAKIPVTAEIKEG